MLDLIIYSGIVFLGFMAIMNPIAGISIFLTLTSSENEEEARKIAYKSVLAAFIIVFVFVIAGHLILKIFGISLTALRLTGGILVGIIGYDMLQGYNSNVSKPSTETINKSMEEEANVAYAPLATPLLAGPGVIITAMNFASKGLPSVFITIVSFAVLCLITYYCFVFGKKIKQALGTSSLKVITRMMGLILAVVGMQMFIEGIYDAIKGFV